MMIPPTYFSSTTSKPEQITNKSKHQSMQALAEKEVAVQDENSLFSDCVLDLSKYLTSNEMSTSPQAYFNDIFEGDKGLVKVKEEPQDEPLNRCMSPDDMTLNDTGFVKKNFVNSMNQPHHLENNQMHHSPKMMAQVQFQPPASVHSPALHAALQANRHVPLQKQEMRQQTMKHGPTEGPAEGQELKLPLLSQLQRFNMNLPFTSTASSIASSIHSSATTSDIDGSDEEIGQNNLSINPKRLHNALSKLENSQGQFAQLDVEPKPEPCDLDGYFPNYPHENKLKVQQHAPLRIKGRKYIEKGTEEYVMKRERNNVAVRKSRTKAKLKHIETQMRVGELSEENSQLRNHVAALQKEVQALKSYINFHIPSSPLSTASSPGKPPAHLQSPTGSTVSSATSRSQLLDDSVASGAPPVSPVMTAFSRAALNSNRPSPTGASRI